MEEIACGRVRTRPDGRGKQRDVGRRKARHRDRTDQLLQNGIPFPLTVREDVRLVAALADRAHQFSTVAALSSDLLFPDDRDAAGGEIDARPFDCSTWLFPTTPSRWS